MNKALLKEPRVILAVVLLIAASIALFVFRGSLFGGKPVADGMYINVVTGERHNWSWDRYSSYRVKTAKDQKREIYQIEPAEGGGFIILERYRATFLKELEDHGISAEQASKVVDLSTLRIRDEYAS